MEEINTIRKDKHSVYQDDDEFLKEFDALFNLAFIEKRKLSLTDQDDFNKYTFSNFLTSTPQSSAGKKVHSINYDVENNKQVSIKGSDGCSSNSSSSGVSEEDCYNSNNSKKKGISSCKKLNNLNKDFSETCKIIDSLLEPITTISNSNSNSNNDNTINKNDFNEYDNLIISPKFSSQLSENKAISSNSLLTIVKENEIDMDEFLELVKSKTKYDQFNKKCSSMSTTSSTSLLSNEEKFYHHHVIQKNNDDTDLDESDDFGPANSSMVEENHHNQNFVTLTSVLKSSSKIKSLAAKEVANNLFIDDISSIQNDNIINDLAATETCIKTFKSTKSSTRSYKRKNTNYHYHQKTNHNENLHKNLSNTLIQLLIMVLAINNNKTNNNQIKKNNKSNYLSKLNKIRKYKHNNNSNSSYNSSSSNNSSHKNNLLNVSNDLLKKAIDYQLLDLLTNNLAKQNEMSNINSKKYCCSYNKSNSLTIQHHHLGNLHSTGRSKNNKSLKLKRNQQYQINHRLNLLEIPNIDDPLIFIDNLYDQLLARRKSDHHLENLNSNQLNTSNSSSTRSTSNNFNSTIGCNLSTDSVHDEEIENEELELNKQSVEQDNANLSLNNPNNHAELLYYNQNDFSHINLYSIDTNVSDALSLANETNLLDMNQNLVDWNYDTTTDICNITNNINDTLTTKLNSNIDHANDENNHCLEIDLEPNDSFNQMDYYETESCNHTKSTENINGFINRDANNNYFERSKNLNLEEENIEQDKKYNSECEFQIKQIEIKNNIDRESLMSSSSTSIATWPTITASLSSINTFDSVSKLTKSKLSSTSSSSSIASSSYLNDNFESIENLYLTHKNDSLRNQNSFVIKNKSLIKPIYYVNSIGNFPCNFLPLSYFLKPFNNIINSVNYYRLFGRKSFLTTSSIPPPQPSTDCKYLNSASNLASSYSSTNQTTVSFVNSTPKLISSVFDSVLKSIKFFILTKNVIFVPLLLFLLNSKANDTLMTSDKSLNLLTFNDTRTTIAATAVFSTLMTLYCP